MTARLRRLLEGIRALFTGPRSDDDLDEELADYLARAVERKMANGVNPEDALRLARAEMGSPAAIRDHVRDVGRGMLLGTLWQDVRYGVRLMGRSRGFTLVAALVLSLGVGVTTTLFSIVNALFFTPLPVKAPEELVYVYTHRPSGQADPIRRDEIDGFVLLGAELAGFTSYGSGTGSLARGGETRLTRGEVVDANYFDLLGVRLALGRPLGALDGAATEPAMVIGHQLWTSWFGADPGIIGQQVGLSRTDVPRMFTIVGVAADGFRGVSDPWAPSEFWITSAHADAQGAAGRLVARLKPGKTVEQFRAFVETATSTLKESARRNQLTADPRRVRLSHQMIDQMHFIVFRAVDVRTPSDPNATLIPAGMAAALIVVVTLVLVIAAANVAGLLLARGVSRVAELAVRRALGADGRRLMRQLLTESILLAVAGGGLGIGVAWNLVAIFRTTTPGTFVLDVPLDWRVVMFAAVVCVGTGVLVGLAPAIQAVRVNVLEGLGTGIASPRHTRARLRQWIVIPQIASSLVLLVVAAVHVRSLSRIERTDLGYDTSGAIVVRARLGDSASVGSVLRMPDEVRRQAYDRMTTRAEAFTRSLLDRVSAVAGVESSALTAGLPVRPYYSNSPYQVTGSGSAGEVDAARTRVSGEYFDAMRIRLLSGRTFDSRDTPRGRKVAVISESLARRLWPGGQALGKTIAFEIDRALTSRGIRAPTPLDSFEVIGVVEDVTPVLGTPGDRPLVYQNILQPSDRTPAFFSRSLGTLIVRGSGNQAALIQRVRAAVTEADAFAEVVSIHTTEQIVGEILYPQRVGAAVLVAAGLVGLTLAALGLYGLVSYSVAQRQREIGIRATLGAGPRDLIGLVLREGGRVIAIGGGVGLVVAAIAVRLTAGLVPGLPYVDMVALVGVPMLLAVIVLAACYVAARRASRLDPIATLRES